MTAPYIGRAENRIATHHAARHGLEAGRAILQLSVVGLTLATAVIHASLGGLLFTLNAVGYASFAVALVLPGTIGRYRWLVRLALLGFTAATIGGWLLFGARFPLAYLDKGIEVALIVFVSVELWALDGGPGEIVTRARRLAAGISGSLVARR